METTEFLQNQSQIISLDISHVLSKHFGSLFVRDCVDPEIVENLSVSQGSTDKSHVKYVDELMKITVDRQKVIDETNYLKEHILWARDEALKEDEKIKETNKEYEYLHLPPDETSFFKYIDNELLRKNGLIAPEDVFVDIQLRKLDQCFINSTSEMSIYSQSQNKDQELVKQSKKKDYHLPPIEMGSSKEISNKKKSGKIRKPVDMILATEKEENRFMLEMMNAKNNYLKNPRHSLPQNLNDSKSWLIQTKNDSNTQKLFLSIPEVVEFSDYEVGKVYQKLINFRNITAVLRSIRVLPPKTRYFSLGLGQFPGEKGLVAAGISCQYPIRFSPDSLGDYEDEIIVETQGGLTFSVQLIGKRPRPILTGSTLWNMNFCLIYGLKVIHYKIKNTGGSGKFCIADSAIPLVSNAKAVFHGFQTVIEPFVIRPSHFELRTNESINLELIFCPNTLGPIGREFTVICDNCHLETFKIMGNGEMATISIETIEGGASVPEIDESTDISAQTLFKFNSLNPFTYCQKTLVLKNESHTEIPFCWKVVKPNLKSPSMDMENLDLNLLKNRTLDFDSAFVIEPAFGIFSPNENLPFTITFAPLEVKSYHSVFHLVLQGIPDFKPEQLTDKNLQNEGLVKQKSFPKHSDDSFPEIQSSSSLSPNNLKVGAISLNDVTSLEIEVKGISVPLKVYFNTPSILVPGELLIHTPVRKPLQIINQSTCPISLCWDKPDSLDYIFEVEPKIGLIDSEEIGVVDVCIVANKPGFFRDTLLCHIETLDNPLELVVEAFFKGPEVEIDINDLDFGLVKVNETVTQALKFFNQCSINCSWRARIGGSDDTELFDEMTISPKSGVLGPLKSQQLIVTFTPKRSKLVDCGIEIAVENGSTKCLNVLATVQSPKIVLSSSNLVITGKLFVNTATVFTVTMCNQSHLESKFKWQPPIGDLNNTISIISDPSNGTIEGNGKLDVKVIITSMKQGEMDDIILPCFIEGVDDPIGLNISGIVLGPSFNYSVFNSIDDARNDNNETILENLNFGGNVPLFENVKKYLLIENNTSIVTDFILSIDYFKASAEYADKDGRSVKKRANLADRQSKPDKLANFDFNKSMLKLKNGISVGFNPSKGTLLSYEKILVEVTAYNDMWGQYTDFIRLFGKAHNIPTDEIIIPMSISVIGNPMEFTMTAGRKEQKPILRLGSKPFGEEAFSRQIRLNNKSCCDIFINWEMYNYIDEWDEKLIDVILNFDDPFPLDFESPKSNNDSQRFSEFYNFTESNVSNSTRLITERTSAPVTITDRNQGIYSDKNLNNLISLIVRPHEGILANNPISFQPQQVKIPAESYGFVTITFDPQYFKNEKEISWDENGGISFNNFLLGFMSLEKRDLNLENRVSRFHQFSVDQIKLDVTCRILLPNLQIDFPDTDEREEVFFSIPFSSLLVKNEKNYSLSKNKVFKSYATLRNLQDTETRLSLKTRSPFEMDNAKSTEEKEIKIGETVKISVKFILDREHMSLLKDENLYNHNDSHCLKIENQILPNESQRSAKMVQFRDVISVTYKNTNIEQLIPIRAQIFFPEFIVSKSFVDFATCFVGETSTSHIRVINKSNSASVLFLKIVNCSDSIFDLSPTSGLIQSVTLNSDDNQIDVCLKFTPRQACEYSANIIVTGIMGEEDCIIHMNGKGSYDNKYQKKY